jgi:hypothetical protein
MGFDRTRLLKFAEESLPPIAGVLLVVGAGGGFGRVLVTAHLDYGDRKQWAVFNGRRLCLAG